jgi:hypothetical protein
VRWMGSLPLRREAMYRSRTKLNKTKRNQRSPVSVLPGEVKPGCDAYSNFDGKAAGTRRSHRVFALEIRFAGGA